MKAYKDLIKSLDKLVTVYRHLLDVVRRENEVLVAIEMEKVVEINEAKEKLVLKIRQLDASWQGAADELAKKLQISSIAVYEVASFYSMFELEPVGKHTVAVCTNLSCMLRGGEEILSYLEEKLEIKCGETSADGKFYLKKVILSVSTHH